MNLRRSAPNGSDSANTTPGELRRSWRRVVCLKYEDAIFVMAKRKYNVYAKLGVTLDFMERQPTILDKSAGPGLLNFALLPHVYHERIKREPASIIWDANNNRLRIEGQFACTSNLGRKKYPCRFG